MGLIYTHALKLVFVPLGMHLACIYLCAVSQRTLAMYIYIYRHTYIHNYQVIFHRFHFNKTL